MSRPSIQLNPSEHTLNEIRMMYAKEFAAIERGLMMRLNKKLRKEGSKLRVTDVDVVPTLSVSAVYV